MSAAFAVVRDARDKFRERVESALLYRADPKRNSEHRSAAREFTGLSLVNIARECLKNAGQSTQGNKDEIVARALEGKINLAGAAAGAEYFYGGAESTSDFPAIVANVANKSLRQAYEALPRTFLPFSALRLAPDFKPVNRAQLSDASALQQLNEKGEYHRGTLTDANVSYSLKTYGEIIAITRKAIMNDDLNAFARVPALVGVAAARLESDLVYGMITGNAIIQSDGIATFAAQHNNLFTGAGSALGITGLAYARRGLLTQTSPQGTYLNLTPRYLIVPAALETTAQQLVDPLDIASTAATAVVPRWIRSLELIVEPRLDVASTTAWYLFCDYSEGIDTVEYSYLEGTEDGPYIEVKNGFEVDGVEIKARMDFASATIDFRGMVMNAGA